MPHDSENEICALKGGRRKGSHVVCDHPNDPASHTVLQVRLRLNGFHRVLETWAVTSSCPSGCHPPDIVTRTRWKWSFCESTMDARQFPRHTAPGTAGSALLSALNPALGLHWGIAGGFSRDLAPPSSSRVRARQLSPWAIVFLLCRLCGTQRDATAKLSCY